MTNPTMQEAAEILSALSEEQCFMDYERLALKLAAEVLGGGVENQYRCSEDEEWSHCVGAYLDDALEDSYEVRRILILPATDAKTGETK